VVIVIMSALGGSMFPRFLMSAQLKTAGLFTFNAWALDGYQKVFWYETGLLALVPQLAVLLALALVFMGTAVAVAQRRAAH
jgi:ABC-2 type transport system permease protein